MRPRLGRGGILLLLVALLLPSAVAQSPFAPLPTTIRLDFDDPESPAGATYGAPVTATATVTYCYTAAGAAAGRPTRVTIDVSQGPDWGAVIVSPSLFDVPFAHVPLGTQDCAQPQHVRFSVMPHSGRPRGPAMVSVNVTAHENFPNAASSSTNSAFIGPATMRLEDARPHPMWSASPPAPMPDGSIGLAPFALIAVVLVAGTGALVARRRR